MNKKKKTDCVRIKAELQEQLMKEYASNQDKYSSYAEFLRSTASMSTEVKAFKDKVKNVNA